MSENRGWPPKPSSPPTSPMPPAPLTPPGQRIPQPPGAFRRQPPGAFQPPGGIQLPPPPGYQPVHQDPRNRDPRLTGSQRIGESPWRRAQRRSRPEAAGRHPARPASASYGAGPSGPDSPAPDPPAPHSPASDSAGPGFSGPGFGGPGFHAPDQPGDRGPYGQYDDEDGYEAGDQFVPGFGDYGDEDDEVVRPGRSGGSRPGAHSKGPRGPRRRRLRWLAPLAALLVILVPVAIGGAYAYSFYQSRYHPADYSGPGTGYVVVQVPSGSSPTSLGPDLVKLGVVASARAFVLAAEHSSNPNGLLPGFYGMHLHMKASLAYALLLDPKNLVQVTVTIPEGWRLSQIVAYLGAKSGLPASAYQAVLKNPAQLNLPASANGKPEGYLFPATYEVQPHESALSVLTGMVQRFGQEAAAINLPAAASQVHLTEGQVITMASLVQAEGGRLSDYPKIARVIYNRLALGIPLQLDSTVLYGLNTYGIMASDQQLDSPSPYNTYRHKGLPPGPIDSPGNAAIQAVLHPASGNWIYFVTVNPKTRETLFTSSQAQFEQFRAELEHNLGQG